VDQVVRPHDWITPAVWAEVTKQTKLLVDRGSVVTTKDNDARTARDLAEGSDRAIKALNGEEPDFYIYKYRMILL
jgi:hypothetical protein